MPTFNRLVTPPNAISREMRAYMQAILEVTGLFAGQGFPLELFMENYSYHLQPKDKFPHATLRQNEMGIYYLTEAGMQYFSSRLTSQPVIPGQKVSRSEVIQMIRSIVAESPLENWESFEVEFQENA